MSNILTKLPLTLTAVAVGVTGYVSASKLIPITEALNNKIIETSEFSDDSNSGLDGNLLVQDSQAAELGNGSQGDSTASNSTNSQTLAQNTTNGMTLSELAKYNKAGSCYVAYNSVVYNVSNTSSWSGCTHHGIRGGQDITSRFPHPTSYLGGIPVVGKLVSSGSTSANNGTSNTPVKKSDNDDKYNDDRYDDDKYDDDDHYENDTNYYDNEREYEDD